MNDIITRPNIKDEIKTERPRSMMTIRLASSSSWF